MDYSRIKAEYIAGGTSYRKLAEKYAVPITTLKRIAKKENWVDLRAQTEIKTDTKIVKEVIQNQAKIARKITGAADKLLGKIVKALNDADYVSAQSAKDYATALKRIQEIGGIKSDLDKREQEARIRRLENEAIESEGNGDLLVTFEEDLEEYAE